MTALGCFCFFHHGLIEGPKYFIVIESRLRWEGGAANRKKIDKLWCLIINLQL
jgi:hypothetical protein